MMSKMKMNCLILALVSAVLSTDPDFVNEADEFEKLKREDYAMVVLFTKECCSCTDCVEAEVLLGGMSKELEDNLGTIVVRIKSKRIRSRFGVKNIPALAFTRNNKTALYSGKFEFDEVYAWLQDNTLPATMDLDDSSFEHLTQAATGATTGDWLVLFHDNQCIQNKDLIQLETAGASMKNKVNVACVDTSLSPETRKRFQITSCPQIIFFRHQKMYRYTLSDITANSLKGFTQGFFKNSKSEKVPPPQSLFDKLIDRIILFYNENWYVMLVVLAGTVCTTVMLICAMMRPTHKKNE